ncbi:hypothetical protein KAS50_06720, partial [bacterium]|nr:hypothetical protein [bacterium]
MNINSKPTRRQFIQSAAGGMSLGLLGKSGITAAEEGSIDRKDIYLPRQIWAACVTNFGISPKSQDDNISEMLKRMNNVISFKPDIICLPETFPDARLRNRPPVSETG